MMAVLSLPLLAKAQCNGAFEFETGARLKPREVAATFDVEHIGRDEVGLLYKWEFDPAERPRRGAKAALAVVAATDGGSVEPWLGGVLWTRHPEWFPSTAGVLRNSTKGVEASFSPKSADAGRPCGYRIELRPNGDVLAGGAKIGSIAP